MVRDKDKGFQQVRGLHSSVTTQKAKEGMRLIILSTLLLLPVSVLLAAGGQKDVIARVNNHVITRHEVLERASVSIEQFDPPADLHARAERERLALLDALASLINEKLLLDEAEKLLNKYPAVRKQIEERVEEQVERLSQAAGSKPALQSQLIDRGSSLEDLKKQITEGLLIDAALVMLVARKVHVAPAEVRELYENEHTLVRYRQIIVTAPSDDNKEAAQAATDLVRRARAGEDFAQLASEHSAGPRADTGGLWELNRRAVADLKGGIGAVILDLNPGEVSELVVIDGAYRILKLESMTRSANGPPFEEVQERILGDLTRKAHRKKLEELINRLRREGHIEIIRPQPEKWKISED